MGTVRATCNCSLGKVLSVLVATSGSVEAAGETSVPLWACSRPGKRSH